MLLKKFGKVQRETRYQFLDNTCSVSLSSIEYSKVKVKLRSMPRKCKTLKIFNKYCNDKKTYPYIQKPNRCPYRCLP